MAAASSVMALPRSRQMASARCSKP
jgi:hypothetical protein